MDPRDDVDDLLSDDQRPAWARRIRRERLARDWSQRDTARAMRVHSDVPLPDDASLIRSLKRWEAGETVPDSFNQKLLADTYGAVTAVLFPDEMRRRRASADMQADTGLDTPELVARIQASDVTGGVLEALQHTADRLCTEYPYVPSADLAVEGRLWLRRITKLLDQRLTLSQHREILAVAGTVTLIVGCLEYDQGLRTQAEETRLAAASLGAEAGTADVEAWAQEMRAWFDLTQNNYRGVIAAADTGQSMAPHHSVAVQLAAQKAKAWARVGDRRQVEVALDRGRRLLETLPEPGNLDHHLVVDPAKFDFYAMDCYRLLGEDNLASMYAGEVLRTADGSDGTGGKPMRAAEALVTLGVAAARQDSLSEAVAYGRQALAGERRSLPSLLMVAGDLTRVLQERYPDEAETRDFLDELRTLAA